MLDAAANDVSFRHRDHVGHAITRIDDCTGEGPRCHLKSENQMKGLFRLNIRIIKPVLTSTRQLKLIQPARRYTNREH